MIRQNFYFATLYVNLYRIVELVRRIQREEMDKMNMTENFDKFIDNLDEKNYYMLEEEIDIDIQNKYFKHSRKFADKVTKDEVMNNVPRLSDIEVSVEDKKSILAQLASLRDVEAFRVLEKECRQFDNEELNIWSILAYNESKMILNGSLKNEQQVFISTGLGGRDGKFRYFVVLLPHDNIKKFNTFQKEFIKKELDFTLNQKSSSLERTIEESDEYLSFKVLIPIKTNIPKLFKDILDNCNQLAPFVSKQFIITNVSEMDKEEIEDFMKDIDEDDENSIVEDIVSMN